MVNAKDYSPSIAHYMDKKDHMSRSAKKLSLQLSEFGIGQINGFNNRESLIKVVFGGQTIGLRG